MICPNCKSSFSSICLKCGYDPKTKEAKFSVKELGINELPNVPMEKSHIWLACFPSEQALEDYFEEFIKDDDVTPMNCFARDQGEVFYDHDWVECSFTKSNDLAALIDGHSNSDDYKSEVIEFAKANKILNANSFILADVNEIKRPQSVKTSTYSIWYIGKFTCSV